MQDFFKWFSQNRQLTKPWLMLGKGPSFSLVDQYDTDGYHIISLNHAVRHHKTLLAHMIDFDVPVDCAEAIDRNAQYLLMPWIPHVHNVPTHQNLEELLQEHETLRKLYHEKRILWYNLVTGPVKKEDSPVVPVSFFSAEAVLNLLAMAGVKTVRSLGIDGGNTYSSNFKDITETKLLANGHQTFDHQFKHIARTIMEKKIDYAPLNVESPIKVYVGTGQEQLIPTKVLEYSIRKNTSMSVEVFPLYQSNIKMPMPKDPANKPRTPFSFQRFIIPQLNGFRGKAIYVDSDMQVFTDLRKLWDKPFEGGDILAAYEAEGTGRRPQFSVMLMDCQALAWDINHIVAQLDRGELDYAKLMYEMRVAKNIRPVIEREWNSLEYYEEGKTNLLHYTDMNKQPWLYRNNAFGHVWVRELAEAMDKGFITRREIAEHIRWGNLRPSLLYQLKHKHFEVTDLPAEAKRLDAFFVPPHLRNAQTPKSTLLLHKLLVKAALAYYRF
ncbi:MAG: hypothetical protein AVDCRST_MAG56-4899 [uncultured Cytophagales bacterium]|uniref:Uncharacterized protein n=1 Tax=uncultured Cytophagales bacterium TaxID=158755 RepID=A0A6J4JMM2_9SPHI|nr:MAG: hypothetical protein AVDCRST_MAG56-4899 [uncultured Cytophagales bacterium]